MFKKDFKEILLCVLWEQQSSEFLQKPSLKFYVILRGLCS